MSWRNWITGMAMGALGCWMLGAGLAEAVEGPHDMSGLAPNGQKCVACHAPHKVPNTPLLWNHVLSTLQYSWSDATQTTGGTPYPTNIQSWSGSTKMCMSCHDGTVAVGAIYQPPSVFNPLPMVGSDQIGTTTGDLKGNHPVAIPYPYNNVKNTYNGITTGDLATASGWVAAPTKVKIFTDAAAAGPNNKGIECASCHDPHGTPNSSYLRDTKTGSALCLDCHVK